MAASTITLGALTPLAVFHHCYVAPASRLRIPPHHTKTRVVGYLGFARLMVGSIISRLWRWRSSNKGAQAEYCEDHVKAHIGTEEEASVSGHKRRAVVGTKGLAEGGMDFRRTQYVVVLSPSLALHLVIANKMRI